MTRSPPNVGEGQVATSCSASRTARYEVGQRVKIEWKKRWYYGRIIEKRPWDRYKIHYDGYSDSWDEVVGLDRIENPTDASPETMHSELHARDGVEVRWNNQWYPATVLDVLNDGARIHYNGYDASWDEVVTWDRVRSPERQDVSDESWAEGTYREGESVEVQWGESWYEGSIKRVMGPSRWEVHYDGYSDSWDEVVGPERLRSR